MDDRISIRRDGRLETHERVGRPASAEVSRQDLADLEALFDGWSDRKQRYRAQPVASDGYRYEITHEGETITAAEGLAPIPEWFMRVCRRLEALATPARGRPF
jgi:hypothetical protein